MKKLLILMLVLGLVSTASATLTVEIRDSTGTTPITVIGTGETFTVVLGGLISDMGTIAQGTGYFRLFDDCEALSGGTNYFDFVSTGQPTFVPNNYGYDAAGNGNWTGAYVALYDGYEANAYDLEDANSFTDPCDGDWFIYEAVAGSNLGMATLGLMASDYGSFVVTDTITIVPEPMTIALLGLGGLLLRRRK